MFFVIKDTHMKIVIVGSGNVATVLGKKLKKANYEIVQVLSRTIEHAKKLGDDLGCAYTSNNEEIYREADLYLLAVTDGVLYGMEKLSPIGTRLVVHTAGSVPMDVLQNVSLNYGTLYPLQTLRKEMDDVEDIPLLVNANTAENIHIVEGVARSISGKVSVANDEQRLKLHVAAVVVSNFTNHLYALAEEFCKKENVDFKMLLPLIKETTNRLDEYSPTDVQTGPAFRNDMFTLDKHIRILTGYPKLKYVYLKLTDSIMSR